MNEQSDRSYPGHPLVGVGAVVWDGQRLILTRRGRPPAQGAWAIPGGLIELGETAEQALQREIMEECGVSIALGPILMLFQPIQRDQADRVLYHFVVVDYLARYLSGELRSGDDAVEARWVAPVELPAYELLPATSEVIHNALNIIASGVPFSS